MAGDVKTNTGVTIGEVLELEDKRREFQAIYMVCSTISPNHITLSVPDNRKSIAVDGHELIYKRVFGAQAVCLQANQ